MGVGARLWRPSCELVGLAPSRGRHAHFRSGLRPVSLGGGSVGSHDFGNGGLVMCRPDDPAWLELVRNSPDATVFHHPAWSSAVQETYGYPAFVLASRMSDGPLMGGIPVIKVSNPVGRRRLIALPFTDHCPPLLADGADPALFVEGMARWQHGHGDRSLEVRAALPAAGAHPQAVGTRHLMALEPDVEGVFRRLHRNRIQKRVRRSREAGVEVTLSRSRDELDVFYRLHCETRRRQGVPVQPRRFFERLWQNVIEPGLGFVITARTAGMPIATALFLRWNRHLIYKYGASDRTRWNLGANFLVHWTAIEWGCANGCTTYDLGRTDAGHESLRAFKAGWGAEEVPLIYTHIGTLAPKLERGLAPVALAHLIRHSPAVVGRVLGEVLYRYAA